MKISDKNFRKIFFGLITLAIVFIFGLSFTWIDFTFETRLDTKDIWVIGFLMFVILNVAYDFNQLKIKIASIFVMTGIFGLIFNMLLDMGLGLPLYFFLLSIMTLVVITSHLVD